MANSGTISGLLNTEYREIAILFHEKEIGEMFKILKKVENNRRFGRVISSDRMKEINKEYQVIKMAILIAINNMSEDDAKNYERIREEILLSRGEVFSKKRISARSLSELQEIQRKDYAESLSKRDDVVEDEGWLLIEEDPGWHVLDEYGDLIGIFYPYDIAE